MISSKPTVRFAVLMATYNGIAWIEEQLISIINQANVSVTVFLSDDMSDDGTFEKVSLMAKKYKNIQILARTKHGTPAKNFHYLLESCDFSSFDYVALSDQDDLWVLDKLFKAHSKLVSTGCDAYSSDVIAQYSSGRQKYIKKSHPIKKYDYLFESAGPGCTYVIKSIYIYEYVKFLKLNKKLVSEINCHDWTMYAYMRSNKYNWCIDSIATLIYRQHVNNAEGVNLGFAAYLNRLKTIRSGQYRKKCLLILELFEHDNIQFRRLLNGSWISGIFLLKHIREIRRSFKIQCFMAFFLIFGLFR
jgi:rhamnosyltransferase